MPRGETSNVADGLENVVAAETVLSKVDGEAGVLILRGHYLQDIAGRRSFEWLTGVLWQDFVDRPLSEEALRRDLGQARERAFASMRDTLPIAARLPPLAALRVLLASVPDDADDAPLLLTATVRGGVGGGDPHPRRQARRSHPIRTPVMPPISCACCGAPRRRRTKRLRSTPIWSPPPITG